MKHLVLSILAISLISITKYSFKRPIFDDGLEQMGTDTYSESHRVLRFEYEPFIQKCNWSPDVSIQEHNKKYIANQNQPFIFKSGFVGIRKSGYDDKMVNASVRSCTGEITHINDELRQKIVTQVGPVLIDAKASLVMSIIPKTPLDLENKKSYLIEHFYWMRDQNGNLINYPPIHPHHFITFISGYKTYKTLQDWLFFTARNTFSDQLHSNPGSVADGICEFFDDPLACNYWIAPDGTGLIKQNQSDFTSSLQLDNVVDYPLNVTVEFGTTYAYTTKRKPMFFLNFHNIGKGLIPYKITGGTGENMAWRTYTLPASGQFLRAWFHTHSQIKSTWWILNIPCEKVLPKILFNKKPQKEQIHE